MWQILLINSIANVGKTDIAVSVSIAVGMQFLIIYRIQFNFCPNAKSTKFHNTSNFVDLQ